MRKKVILCGCGNLGRRYLEGLNQVSIPIQVKVIDISIESLNRAREIIQEKSGNNLHVFAFLSKYDNLPLSADLCIQSTNSNCRKDLISKVNENCSVDSWILEKLLAQSSEQIQNIENILGTEPSAWVNTPMRCMIWHNLIKEYMSSYLKDSVHIEISGSHWGLCCNSIHYIDFLSWLIDAKVENICSNGLTHWEKSKRPGFYEAFGELGLTFSDRSTARFRCIPTLDKKPLIIKIFTSRGEWTIYESEGVALGPNEERIQGTLTYQSTMTPELVTGILNNRTCQLPTLHESAIQHRILLDSLLESWNILNSKADRVVPIT